MAEKTKFQFNGQTYSVKGRLCHAIVKYYVEQNPNVTLKALQKAFNTPANMIVATPELAMTFKDNAGKAGGNYYMKENDIIPIKNGQVVVWSYWPERYFNPFMEQVKALGLNIVPEKATSDEPIKYGMEELSFEDLDGTIVVAECFDVDDVKQNHSILRINDGSFYWLHENEKYKSIVDIPEFDEDDRENWHEADFWMDNYEDIEEMFVDGFLEYYIDALDCDFEQKQNMKYTVTVYKNGKKIYETDTVGISLVKFLGLLDRGIAIF